MHGLGNDYVFVDMRTERIDDPATLARALSPRHTGVGSDGLILMFPTASADVRMEIYNADGSRAEMCGNGIRGVAKFVVERGWVGGPEVRIETDAGIKLACCESVGGVVRSVRVDMGLPSLSSAAIPANIDTPEVVDSILDVTDPAYRVTCVSVGNPHAVAFVDDLETVDLAGAGRAIEYAPQFPQRINVHFARVESRGSVAVRTWERGSGVTRACGTGACAVCVAGVVTDRVDRLCTVALPGGDLQIEWARDDHLYMTGPVVEVFNGSWPD